MNSKAKRKMGCAIAGGDLPSAILEKARGKEQDGSERIEWANEWNGQQRRRSFAVRTRSG